LETVAKSAAFATSGSLETAGKSDVGAAAGACVACPLSFTAVCRAQPRQQTTTSASKTVPTAMTVRNGLPKAKLRSELSSFT
jgi:hypothetical protein